MKTLDVITIGRASVDLYGSQVGGRLEDMGSFQKYIGGSPTNMAAVMATGAPNPAVPSKKEPKEKAINKACILLSELMEAIKCLMISNWPLFTVRLKRNTAAIMIQHIGNNP